MIQSITLATSCLQSDISLPNIDQATKLHSQNDPSFGNNNKFAGSPTNHQHHYSLPQETEKTFIPALDPGKTTKKEILQ